MLHELGRLGRLGTVCNVFIRNLQMIGTSYPWIIVGKPVPWYLLRCVGSRAVNALAALKNQATSLRTAVGSSQEYYFKLFRHFNATNNSVPFLRIASPSLLMLIVTWNNQLRRRKGPPNHPAKNLLSATRLINPAQSHTHTLPHHAYFHTHISPYPPSAPRQPCPSNTSTIFTH